MTDPATDQVLWVCAGAAADGRCPLAEKPPYVSGSAGGRHLRNATRRHVVHRRGDGAWTLPGSLDQRVVGTEPPAGPRAIGQLALSG